MKGFEATGAQDGSLYLSVPITSGVRELTLLRALHCSREELRTTHRRVWLATVVEPNEEEALQYARGLRRLFVGEVVIDPSRLKIARWTQRHYNELWSAVVAKYARRMAVAPDWAFSKGARTEVGIALRMGLPIVSVDGEPIDIADIRGQDRAAAKAMLEDGWSPSEVAAYLEPLSADEAGASVEGGSE